MADVLNYYSNYFNGDDGGSRRHETKDDDLQVLDILISTEKENLPTRVDITIPLNWGFEQGIPLKAWIRQDQMDTFTPMKTKDPRSPRSLSPPSSPLLSLTQTEQWKRFWTWKCNWHFCTNHRWPWEINRGIHHARLRLPPDTVGNITFQQTVWDWRTPTSDPGWT